MTKTITVPNLCPRVRIEIEGKAYRVFSIKFKHPSETSEDNWTVFKDPNNYHILIDKETMKVLAGGEIQWLCKEGTMVNTEPTILACEIRVDEELSTI